MWNIRSRTPEAHSRCGRSNLLQPLYTKIHTVLLCLMAMVMMKKTMVMTVMLTVMLFVGCRCDCTYLHNCQSLPIYGTLCSRRLSIQQNARLHVVAGSHRSEKIKAGSLLFVAPPIRTASAGPIAAGPIACTCIGLPSGPIV